MKIFEFIRRTFIRSGRQARSLLQTIANVPQQKQRQTALNELEAERIDRIRNPSKYRGKEI